LVVESKREPGRGGGAAGHVSRDALRVTPRRVSEVVDNIVDAERAKCG
jgi:hypothetical protein